ncbi:MAG TPA: ABC transporter permease [Pyrinomonadaceae bacterium]
MEALINDIRHGIRGMLKHPGFTLVAVITLALAIGANIAIFSVVNAVLLRPLPYHDPERLVRIWETNLARGGELEMTSLSNLLDWQRQNRCLLDAAAWQRLTSLTLTSQTPALELSASVVSANYFSLLGVPAALGRTFAVEESDTQVVVISNELWRRQFASNPQVSGTKIQLEKKDFQIIGVMPHGFKSSAGEADLWLPMNFQPNEIDRGQTYLQVIGRLKPNFTLDQAQAEMDGIAKALAAQFPNSNRDRGIRLVLLSEHTVGSVRLTLFIVLGAVGFVLLIACANVANLFLVKAAQRKHEIAVRAALGASNRRLVQQLLCEAFIVALCGGVLGLFAAAGALELIKSLAPDQLPRLDEIGIDRETLIFTIGASLLSGVLAGSAPALYVCRPNLNDALKDNRTHMTTGGWRRNRLQSAFVVAQVGVALALLSGAGLLIRSFVQLVKVNPGFQMDGLLVARIALGDDYREGNRQVTYFQELANRLRSLPGVYDAAAVTVLPMNPFGIDFDVPYHRAEQAEPANAAAPKAKFRAATPDYFRAMGIPLMKGRGFLEQDRSDSPRVVVVNQLLAERVWPGESPVGKRLRFVWADWQTYEVVGVVGNTKSYGLIENWQPELFVPQAQIPYTVMNVVVRTTGDPAAMTAAVRRTMLEQDPYQPPHSIVPMADLISDSIARERFAMTWLVVLAAIALTLASVGIYSVVSHVTTQRTREVGIRLALGAQTSDVMSLVMRNGMTLVLIGVAIGLAGSLIMTQLIESLLFGVTPTDVWTLASVSALMIVVSILATYIPARRATKVDPLVAFRYE